jgi:hypothetical protein
MSLVGDFWPPRPAALIEAPGGEAEELWVGELI